MGRPSSFVAKNPVTGKWNWHCRCGTNGPGYSSKMEASVALARHQNNDECTS